MLTMIPKIFAKLNKSLCLGFFKQTSDDLSAMFWRTLGKLLDFMMIFLASSDELL